MTQPARCACVRRKWRRFCCHPERARSARRDLLSRPRLRRSQAKKRSPGKAKGRTRGSSARYASLIPGARDALTRATRFHRELGTAVEGSGLGLSIVAEALQLHRGEIVLDISPTLGGLRATVTLPAL